MSLATSTSWSWCSCPERVYDAADRAQRRLGIPVNPTLRSAASWHAADDALVASIKSGAHLVVVSNEIGGVA